MDADTMEAHYSYSDWYANGPYSGYVTERRLGGRAELTLFKARQPAGDYPDPATDDLTLIMNAGRQATPARMDNGIRRYSRPILPGAVVIGPAGLAFDCTVDCGHELLFLSLTRAQLESIAQESLEAFQDDLAPLLESCVGDARLSRLLKHVWALSGEATAASRLQADGLTHLLLGRLLQLAEIPSKATASAGTCDLAPRKLAHVLDYMEAHADAEIGLAQLATVAGLSPSHFSRAFSASTGEPPHRYLMRRRVERAQELLGDTSMSITEIAHASGFSSSQHMATVFQRMASVTPSQYRRERLS